MNLETSKNLGGIGAILMFLTPLIAWAVPYGSLLGLLGLILLLIGLKGLADHYNEGGIFNNMLYSVILIIVGAVVSIALIATMAIGALQDIGFDFANMTSWQPQNLQSIITLDTIMSLLQAVIVGLVLLFIFLVVAAYLARKSLSMASAKTGVGMFGTAGLLLLIGAVLTIILIGFILIWIVFILVAVAFFSMKTTTQQPSPAPPPPS